MKEKRTERFETIHKSAMVGTKGKNVFIFNPPLPKTANKTSPVSIRPNKSRRRGGCSGCSRRRTR